MSEFRFKVVQTTALPAGIVAAMIAPPAKDHPAPLEKRIALLGQHHTGRSIGGNRMPECTDLERAWLDRFNDVDLDELMDALAAVFEDWSQKTREILKGPAAAQSEEE